MKMSCLFNALAHFVEDSPYTIRQNVCDYLLRDTDIFDGVSSSQVVYWDSGLPLDLYVNKMLVGRGVVVVVDDRLGVTVTDMIKGQRGS